MTAPGGWVGLVAGDWTVHGDPRSCARRVLRAGRALGVRTLAVSSDGRCLARLASDGWSLRPAAGPAPADLAAAFFPAGSRAAAPALLLGDGTGLAEPTARAAALLGGAIPDPVALARCAEATAGRIFPTGVGPVGAPARRYVMQVQDGEVVGLVEDVTVAGHGRDYDCPGVADARTVRRLRAGVLAALRAAGLTRGPAEVTVRADGPDASILDIVPGRIDACIASVIELATGHDPVLRAVCAAAGAGPGPGRYGRHAYRHACLRRVDLRTAPHPDAWAGLPGVVSVRPGPHGLVTTVADDRAAAIRAAELAVGRLSGQLPPTTTPAYGDAR